MFSAVLVCDYVNVFAVWLVRVRDHVEDDSTVAFRSPTMHHYVSPPCSEQSAYRRHLLTCVQRVFALLNGVLLLLLYGRRLM